MGSNHRTALGLVGAVLLVAMAVAAVVIGNWQSSARKDVTDRFALRPVARGVLVESLFSSAATTAAADNSKRYGGETISRALLGRRARDARNLFLMVVSAQGRVLAAAPGTSPATIRAIEARPQYIRDALAGRPYTISDIQPAAGGKPAHLVYTQVFKTGNETRALVTGIDAKPLSTFIGSTLRRFPASGQGLAYVLDSAGRLVASQNARQHAGAMVPEPGLVAAIGSHRTGTFGHGRRFAVSPVDGTPWRVVVTASDSTLFESVDGARRWLPWLLFAGFGLAVLAALAFLRRMLRSADLVAAVNVELEGANAALENRADELAHANEELARTNRELGRSNEELERFASIASHDLREPLRKVQMFSERVMHHDGEHLSPRGRDYLERSSDAARRMQALIDGLLAFSRIATQGGPLEDVDLTQVAGDVVDDLHAVIDEAGATVEIGELPHVPADPVQMRQLLQNLISNGLKFRREGVTPVVRVTGRVDGDTAEIVVRDNGIGFEERHGPRIFKVFERLHSRSAYPGTGIGLALCRRIAERHGGTISAVSEPGAGSSFTVRLPLAATGHEPPARPPAAGDERSPLVHR